MTARVALHTGDLDVCAQIARRVRQSGQAGGHPGTRVWGVLTGIECLLRVGEWDEMRPLLQDAHTVASRAGQRVDSARLHVAEARISLHDEDAITAGRALASAEALLAGRAAMAPWAIEAQAGIPEVALDLLESDPSASNSSDLHRTARRGERLLTDFVSAVPTGRPRLYLVRGRLAAADGRRKAAQRAWAASLREASAFGMPWEQALAHDRLASSLRQGERAVRDLDADAHAERARKLLAGLHASLSGASAAGVRSSR